MKIVNNTSLNYQQIGFIIDDIINKSDGETIYYGKVRYLNIVFNGLKINIRIRYLKRYVEWSFTNNERITSGKTNNN